MICLIKNTNSLKAGCPNLILDYKEFPTFSYPNILNVVYYKPVDPMIKSPFDINGPFKKFLLVTNLYLELMLPDGDSSYKLMRNGQLCDRDFPIYHLTFNNIRYKQSENTNKILLKYESGRGDVFCKSEHEMSEIFLIDHVKIFSDTGEWFLNFYFYLFN